MKYNLFKNFLVRGNTVLDGLYYASLQSQSDRSSLFILILDLFSADGLHQTPSQTNSHESTSDGNSDNGGNSSGDEDSQLRLRLKRKLQRNRTSFTNEQIDSLEKGTCGLRSEFFPPLSASRIRNKIEISVY